VHGLRDLPGRGDIGEAQPVGHHPRQRACHHRADADEEALHRIADGALAIGQVVADKGAERLHGDVERGVHDPQHAGRDPQHGRIGHDEQREARQQRADEEIGPAAAEAAPETHPGLVGQVADDRLHDQPRHRRGDPQDGEFIDLGTQRLEDPADIAVLQVEPDLDPEKAEAHVPDLARAQCGLVAAVSHCNSSSPPPSPSHG